MRNRVQCLVREAKRAYYERTLSRERGTAGMWNRLRHLGLVRQRSREVQLACSPTELNQYFTTCAQGETAEAVLPSSHSDLSVSPSITETFDDSKFYWKYVTSLQMRRAIARMHSNALGTDGVSLRFLKVVMPRDSNIIEHLLNCSLEQLTFPRIWKSALISPIPKIKNPTAVEHYRPIAILPALTKVFERVVCDQIQDYMEESGNFDPCQFAYRRNHSTQTCILRMLDDVREAFDRRMVTVSVFFDLSKAFDRVDFKLLIAKLRALGFSARVLIWIESYLTGRSQAVRDTRTGEISESMSVDVGVPQGSVLGPLLFILYITDFAHVLRHCKYNIYADDLQIYLHCPPDELEYGLHAVNSEIVRVVDWARQNKLLLNAQKTQAIIFGTSRYLNGLRLDRMPSLVIDDTPIAFQDQVKYLGITLTVRLSWEPQVTGTVGIVHTIHSTN